ncbi:hypothetical protein A1Q2_03457 [Trichosporon asahii var. asahii CBS 8904]|uniref:F-box domain-containing protein n=1 Tax=Trichosporon asahii var. asahii (strain CBS 8904) TaxID=1220162 RepID=K1VRX0_TRIAC|nr:hypothetical protein A1Q2_03457 [Trichosporon asahii var. asahii CBS 8904]
MLAALYNSYPHIFNDIFDTFFHDADIKTLLRLRLTCRLLQHFVDDTWGHLRWQAGPTYQGLGRWPAASAVRDWRGHSLSTVSPFLSLTTVLDLNVSSTVLDEPCRGRVQDWRAFPASLKVQVLRMVRYDRWAMRFVRLPPARTVVIYHAVDVRHTMSSISYLPSVNVVWKLDYANLNPSMGTLCDNTGPCQRTNVFVLLSNCDPKDTHLGGLWQGMVETVAENVRYGKQTFFYLVDVQSWFARSDDDEIEPLVTIIPDEPEPEELRMDHILDDPDAFYDLISSIHEEYVRRSPLCGEDLVELVAAGCRCSSFIRRISTKEMRMRIGDKATSFALAPIGKTLHRK